MAAGGLLESEPVVGEVGVVGSRWVPGSLELLVPALPAVLLPEELDGTIPPVIPAEPMAGDFGFWAKAVTESGKTLFNRAQTTTAHRIRWQRGRIAQWVGMRPSCPRNQEHER